MKKGTCVFAFLLALLLVFTGCQKQEEEPQTPDVPPAEQPETPVQPEEPLVPAPIPDPFGGLSPEDEQFIEDHEYWLDTVSYALEADGYTVLDAILLESAGEYGPDTYQVWRAGAGMPGKRVVQRLLVTLTPDGKGSQVDVAEDDTFDQVCQAVQNYLLLQSDLQWGAAAVPEGLGFDTAAPISYTDFYAAMMRLVTPELFSQHYAQYFRDQDGTLVYDYEGEGGTVFVLDGLTLKEDGSYAAEYHGYYAPGTLWPRKANVTLEALPTGGLAVSGWEGVE